MQKIVNVTNRQQLIDKLEEQKNKDNLQLLLDKIKDHKV
jgi:hypothetical protein